MRRAFIVVCSYSLLFGSIVLLGGCEPGTFLGLGVVCENGQCYDKGYADKYGVPDSSNSDEIGYSVGPHGQITTYYKY